MVTTFTATGQHAVFGQYRVLRRAGAATAALLLLGLSACGGAKPAAYPAEPVAVDESPDPSWETEEPVASEEPQEPAETTPEEKKKPVFTDGMGVDEAISAVPSHYEYVGLDQEVLAKPLTQLETYKECKVKPSDKFKVRIAVWEGKVVGANVTSTNKVLAQCIDGVVRRLEYKDQVESINTVEYSF
jgi:hypothetical protein